MTAFRLILRSLSFHARSSMAVGLGAATACAVLTGALLVGVSMRASLRETAIRRLSGVDHALSTTRLVREELAAEVAAAAGFPDDAHVAPLLMLRGGATHAGSRARADRLTILGVNERFWAATGTKSAPALSGRAVAINAPLAAQLGAGVGDVVLLRFGKVGAVSPETLLGRRDETGLTLRVPIVAVIDATAAGGFSLDPGQSEPLNAYVPIATLQRALEREERVNAIVVNSERGARTAAGAAEAGPAAMNEALNSALASKLSLADYGLLMRVDAARGYFALESGAMLIEPQIEDAALAAARALGLPACPQFTYLANEITQDAADNGAIIPYSVVTALPPDCAVWDGFKGRDGQPIEPLQPGEIALNDWAAEDLGVAPGAQIKLTYYVTEAYGALETRTATLTLKSIPVMNQVAADPGFAPTYPGITDAESLSDWDPPFPIDLKRIRDQDEEYWKAHRTAPKAFLNSADALRLWGDTAERFGRSTSIRFPLMAAQDASAPPAKGAAESQSALAMKSALTEALLTELRARPMGLAFAPVRERAVAASAGNTDFGMLFIGFSFFLIASSAMLVALLFRLGAERRAAETGMLAALGFAPRRIRRLLLAEGAVIGALGCAVGLPAAMGYAWLMLAGLRSWWSAAVSAPFLELHVPPMTLAIGYAAALCVAMASLAWSLRGLLRQSPRALLSGNIAADRATATTETSDATPAGDANRRGQRPRAVGAWILPLLLSAAALALLIAPTYSGALPTELSFFAGGAALLAAALTALRAWLRADRHGTVHGHGAAAWMRLGMRNAPRYPMRSLLTAGLIASASFLIAALGAFRVDPQALSNTRDSGTGGFNLVAESVTPLPYDLNSAAGRESLGISPDDAAVLAEATITPFRLRTGDETSCLSLYRADNPRILGATAEMIARGGFQFSRTMAESTAERANPWLLLNRTFADGAVAAIGDEAAVKWQLHRDLGQDLVITDDHGRQVRLRFVALLSGSVLQSELIVSEAQFVTQFPTLSGYSFYLIAAPADQAEAVSTTIERELERFSVDVSPAAERLAAYLAVQNTYIGTFQLLGGLGLVLGTVGLSVVLLRNVWERRGELALLRAVGYSRRALGWVVLSENALLVIAGLVCGVVPALIAIMPQLIRRPEAVPWVSLTLTLLGVVAVGLGVGWLALRPVTRVSIISALRRE